MTEVKKRGRKPIIRIDPPEDKNPRKRGRKKKFENNTLPRELLVEEDYKVDIKDNITEQHNNYSTNNLKFGNLNIKIYQPDEKKNNLSYLELNYKDLKDKECLLLSSEDEKSEIVTKTINKKNINKKEKTRCFNCHHYYENDTFYLPVDYEQKLDRYKIIGNFCSPNCVKSYGMNNIILSKKIHLIGEFYRKLFGIKFTIKPAPSIFNLKDYGGKLSITEYRNGFYRNDYSINNITSKILFI